MVTPPPYPPNPQAATGGAPPYGSIQAVSYDTAREKLRIASNVTMSGGLIVIALDLLLVGTFVQNGEPDLAAFLVIFGVLPGVAILLAGAMMRMRGASVGTWVWIAGVCALVSLLTLGGLFVGAIVALAGAGLAHRARRTMATTAAIYPVSKAPPSAARPGAGATPMPRPAPPVHAGVVGDFLAMDPDRSFDLEVLNGMDFALLSKRTVSDQAVRSRVFEKSEELLERIESDTGDIESIDDVLRDRLVIWYRDSPTDPEWTRRKPLRWAGLVAETHIVGGARTPAISARLRELRDEVAPSSGPARHAFRTIREGTSEDRSPSHSLPAKVVQAILDDISRVPHAKGSDLPLLRLSELAVKSTPSAVNQTLSALFKGDARGPFVILHPSRFPGFEFVSVRPPPVGAAGAAIAYDLVCQTPETHAAKGGVAQLPRVVARVLDENAGDALADVWRRDGVGEAAWLQILAEAERRRARLPAPPSHFRKLPAYFDLRALLIKDAEARRRFLAVRWRGKPPGIGLVAQLLADRSLAPSFETDGEYLEAELSDMERGDPTYRPKTNVWTISDGVRIKRTGPFGQHRYEIA